MEREWSDRSPLFTEPGQGIQYGYQRGQVCTAEDICSIGIPAHTNQTMFI